MSRKIPRISWEPDYICFDLENGNSAISADISGRLVFSEITPEDVEVAVNNHNRLVEVLREVVEVASFRDYDEPEVVRARTLLAQLDGELE